MTLYHISYEMFVCPSRGKLDLSGIDPGPMNDCDLIFSRLKYDCLVKRSQALRGRNLTRDSQTDGAPMHQAPDDDSCQRPFQLPNIGHPRYAFGKSWGPGQSPGS